MIQLYCGDGKGKTTAALGQLIRMNGWGEKTVFCQFMKGNDTGELHSLENIKGVRILRSEKDFGFYKSMTEKEKLELTGIHNRLLEELLMLQEKEEAGLIVLDEITYPVEYGLIDINRLKLLLKRAGEKKCELVLTGRDPADFLMESADYITRMEKIRHPFDKGIMARKGIEY